MSDSNESEEHEPDCPVCKAHSPEDANGSLQVVLRGVQAFFEADEAMIDDVFKTLTPYDGHIAISFAYMLMHDLAVVTGFHPIEAIENYRERLREAQEQS